MTTTTAATFIQARKPKLLRPEFAHSKKKKERRTKAAPATPTKGRVEQHLADAPFRGRGCKYCFYTQGPFGPGWSFCGKQFLTLARQFNCWVIGESPTLAGIFLCDDNCDLTEEYPAELCGMHSRYSTGTVLRSSIR